MNVLDFGADRKGRTDSAPAIEAAIAAAQASGRTVYIPEGTFRVDRHIVVDDITIEGAGHWYTKIKGSEVALAEPAADGSVHTGVGFYGKDAAAGGSHDVHLSGFAIEGDVRERIDTDQVNAIGGAFHDSSFTDLHIQHTKVGLWFDGPMSNVVGGAERDRRPDRRRAELPHRRHRLGRARQLRPQQRRRRPGDVGGVPRRAPCRRTRATCSTTTPCRRRRSRTASRSTAAPTTRVSNNLVADTIREGSALHAGSRFGRTRSTGADLREQHDGPRRARSS